MDSPITRAEHNEFVKRMEEHNSRQDARIKKLEELVDKISVLSTSIEKMATNMENMFNEQVSQGKRLETLESRDGEKWREVVKYVLTLIVGACIGYILKQMGIQ